jgi:hypothetical protein
MARSAVMLMRGRIFNLQADHIAAAQLAVDWLDLNMTKSRVRSST